MVNRSWYDLGLGFWYLRQSFRVITNFLNFQRTNKGFGPPQKGTIALRWMRSRLSSYTSKISLSYRKTSGEAIWWCNIKPHWITYFPSAMKTNWRRMAAASSKKKNFQRPVIGQIESQTLEYCQILLNWCGMIFEELFIFWKALNTQTLRA